MNDVTATILLVEDNPADARLLLETLRQITENKFEITHVQQLSEAVAKLAESGFDAVLLDLSLPDSNGLETVECILSAAPSLPIIVLTGLKDETIGIQAVRRGAQDYLIKGQTNSDLLIRVINYSIERKRIEGELRKARDELEIRVKERTIKLEKTVDELRDEISRRIKAEKKIRAYQKQLRSLTAELVLTEERERRRIAQDLHDSIGQILSFSGRELKTLQKSLPGKMAGALKEITNQLDNAVEQARTLSFDLSPSTLYDLGFEVAVEDLVDRMSKKRKIRCCFENCKLPKPMTDDVKVLLYRSVRELLINVAKHANAGFVKVSLLRLDSDIYIKVEDDGRGFDVSVVDGDSKKAKGFGILSIRERLNHIGGRCEIESAKGKGTRVTLVAPLQIETKQD